MSPFDLRFTICTYNIWTTTRWPERRQALQSFIQHHRPDILCLQEVQQDSRHALDEILQATHERVDDAFEGWMCEGNIYWNSRYFTLVEYGAEQIGILEQFRRLFWVRLQLNDDSGTTLLVATAHYTWHGHPEAVANEKYVRMPQARATVEVLNRLAKPDEPQFFMGDLNDQAEAVRILLNGGWTDCFSALGRKPNTTWPAHPSQGPACTLDWLMHRGSVRPMTAEVVDYYDGDMAPSDHKPVLATYALENIQPA